jgi:hypothetical protein
MLVWTSIYENTFYMYHQGSILIQFQLCIKYSYSIATFYKIKLDVDEISVLLMAW